MNTRNTDYRRLLDDYLELYEELKGTMDDVDLLVTDIKLATEDIHESFRAIDRRMNHCTEQLRCLVCIEPLRESGFQGSATASDPEAGEA